MAWEKISQLVDELVKIIKDLASRECIKRDELEEVAKKLEEAVNELRKVLP